MGSFSSGQIFKSWSLGKGRMATQLGQVAVSLSADGSSVAVSLIPNGNSLPKGFENVRLFSSSNGAMLKGLRTERLIGQIALMPNSQLLAARIDTPGLFSKKACLELWNLQTGVRDNQFCDEGRNVSAALGVAVPANRVVGFGSQIHKSIEGQAYAASGRIDMWDLKSAALIASSEEVPHFVSSLVVSQNGEWVLADQELLRLSSTP